MNAQQVFFRRRFGAQQGEPARQAGHVHQVLHAPFGFRRLGVAGARRRLHPAADRQGGGVQAGAVPETAFIKQETGCSFTFLLPVIRRGPREASEINSSDSSAQPSAPNSKALKPPENSIREPASVGPMAMPPPITVDAVHQLAVVIQPGDPRQNERQHEGPVNLNSRAARRSAAAGAGSSAAPRWPAAGRTPARSGAPPKRTPISAAAPRRRCRARWRRPAPAAVGRRQPGAGGDAADKGPDRAQADVKVSTASTAHSLRAGEAAGPLRAVRAAVKPLGNAGMSGRQHSMMAARIR